MVEDIRRLKQLPLDEESVDDDVARSAKYAYCVVIWPLFCKS